MDQLAAQFEGAVRRLTGAPLRVVLFALVINAVNGSQRLHAVQPARITAALTLALYVYIWCGQVFWRLSRPSWLTWRTPYLFRSWSIPSAAAASLASLEARPRRAHEGGLAQAAATPPPAINPAAQCPGGSLLAGYNNRKHTPTLPQQPLPPGNAHQCLLALDGWGFTCLHVM